jgi:hypothetical protein
LSRLVEIKILIIMGLVHLYTINNNNNNNNYIYPGYPHHLRVFQWGPASKLQLFTILIANIKIVQKYTNIYMHVTTMINRPLIYNS